VLLRVEGVSQVIKTYKQSKDPDFVAKKNRVLELCEIADGEPKPKKSNASVVICMDEFGPLYLHTQSCRTEAASRSRFVQQLPRCTGGLSCPITVDDQRKALAGERLWAGQEVYNL